MLMHLAPPLLGASCSHPLRQRMGGMLPRGENSMHRRSSEGGMIGIKRHGPLIGCHGRQSMRAHGSENARIIQIMIPKYCSCSSNMENTVTMICFFYQAKNVTWKTCSHGMVPTLNQHQATSSGKVWQTNYRLEAIAIRLEANKL